MQTVFLGKASAPLPLFCITLSPNPFFNKILFEVLAGIVLIAHCGGFFCPGICEKA
jgi:hypothetical protein